MPPATIDHARLRHLIEVELMPQQEAAALLGCSKSCIERTCKRLGLITQRTGPRSGDKHPDWTGGRVLIGRYWHIWSGTHPRRTKKNYVAEHRLLCEARLGRYLSATEVVHHANGNPQDNSLENLVVFSSNAEHLKHELTGRIPNWTPEGRERILQGVRQKKKPRAPKASGDRALPPDTAHPETTT